MMKFLRSARKSAHTKQQPPRRSRALGHMTPDVEEAPTGNRQFQREVRHLASNNEEETEPLTEDGGESSGSHSDGDGDKLQKQVTVQVACALAERLDQLDSREIEIQEKRQEKALKSIMNKADSAQGVIEMISTLIEEDWLGTTNELPGNMYRALAFGEMQYKALDCSKPISFLFDNAQFFGCFIIWLIQVFGPIALIRTYLKGYGLEFPFHWEREWNLTLSDWSVKVVWTRVMSLLFLKAFLLNGIFVITAEMTSWRKVDWLFRMVVINKDGTTKTGGWRFALFLGAFTNCYVIVASSVASFFILGNSQNAKDVLFDALGLLFLYNLDDIGGDFAFVDADSWPGHGMSWITDDDNPIVMKVIGDAPDDWKVEKGENCCIVWAYRATVFILSVGIMVAPLVFTLMPWTLLTCELNEQEACIT